MYVHFFFTVILFTGMISVLGDICFPLKTPSTVKPVLSGHSKINKTKVLKTNGSLMKVESTEKPVSNGHSKNRQNKDLNYKW